MRLLKGIFKTILGLVELMVLAMMLANLWVYALTNGRTYTKVSKIPAREVALVLGTSPKMRSGIANPYFTKRMEAVSALYHYGKIKKIIVSGEKSPYYDEPQAMTNYLIRTEGIPEGVIIQDPKGFSTKESIVRCKNNYKKNEVIIISQGFHNLRALFIARNLNMNALAFGAQDVTKPESFYRNHTREFLARVQAVAYFILGID
ncbi:ElyC/SanA/YdcF family protein [Riemerella anatipestifer]|uniref:SanA/YdcF family protein n=1 Tax=Riemerella anatipestifer TaxID=34085 RepID=UPI002A8427D7|nr:ElyC/SanA/YdcF family protein [Riemerella anatipestifer]